MTKQIKLIKFMLVVLIIIPILLFATAVVQTFILKSKQNKLQVANTILTQKQQELESSQEILDYVESDEYKEEHKKHINPNLGNEGDINIILK